MDTGTLTQVAQEWTHGGRETLNHLLASSLSITLWFQSPTGSLHLLMISYREILTKKWWNQRWNCFCSCSWGLKMCYVHLHCFSSENLQESLCQTCSSVLAVLWGSSSSPEHWWWWWWRLWTSPQVRQTGRGGLKSGCVSRGQTQCHLLEWW